MPSKEKQAKQLVESAIAGKPVVVFSKSGCGYCHRVNQLLRRELGLGEDVYEVVNISGVDLEFPIQAYLRSKTGGSSVPRVFVGGKFVGGCDETCAAHKQNKLKPMLQDAGAIQL